MSDVQKIIQSCSENEIFKQDHPWILLLKEEGGKYVLNILCDEGDWDDEEFQRNLHQLNNTLAHVFFKKSVQLMLYDDWAEQKKPVPAPAGLIMGPQETGP
ncbi:MAG TPA: hypothetical protein PLB05_07805 [Candidatus Omnitrophota bacterium]|jgi:hypothetical protein|nr:hypothetical protein [Candidatus Omnitrophota bacterium]HPN55240.1 hypothetical protein [Candidatus Omnitrophota bacterium]